MAAPLLYSGRDYGDSGGPSGAETPCQGSGRRLTDNIMLEEEAICTSATDLGGLRNHYSALPRGFQHVSHREGVEGVSRERANQGPRAFTNSPRRPTRMAPRQKFSHENGRARRGEGAVDACMTHKGSKVLGHVHLK
ncbi:hypothetical protein Bbelb_133670 [Branchiostoma belcheri]|nr:hypothetical protein Bbelb_133670 [Branchiostoma belcheri]